MFNNNKVINLKIKTMIIFFGHWLYLYFKPEFSLFCTVNLC